MAHRDDIERFIDEYLATGEVRDYGPNGIQVEGREQISKMAMGVSASSALIERSIAWGADAVLVHHGIFWGSAGELRVKGSMKARLAPLVRNDVTLYAYHLPLDRHLEVGNNAVLARALGGEDLQPAFYLEGVTIGVTARFAEPRPAGAVFADIARVTEREPLVVPGGPKHISSFGIVTGGAPKLLADAVRLGVDMYITGEPNEATVHLAREEKIHFVAAGHHATERFGLYALADVLRRETDLDEIRFIDINNEV